MKKNVCMLAYTNYLTDARVRRAAETLAASDTYNVCVLVLKEETKPKSYSLSGVGIEELNVSKYRGKNGLRYIFSYINFVVRAFFRLNAMLFSNALDIVHVHNMPNFLILAAVLPKMLGRKIILDVHDTMLETYLAKFDGQENKIASRALRLEESLSCSLADGIICVNHVQQTEMLKRGIPRKKITIVINAPDPKIFNHRKTRPFHNGESKQFRLVYHGTIAKRLGIDLTIRAVSQLIKKIPEVEFHIVGNGDDKPEAIELCRELNLDGRIFFRDIVPLEQLVGILDQMDLGVISNRKNIATELMLPVKMLECVAVGIPVVAPRLKTIERYFSEEMVYYFQPDDVESLASSIFEAYQNDQTRRAKAENAKTFLLKYGWDTHKYALINLYAKLSN